MITKEIFVEFINNYKYCDNLIDTLNNMLTVNFYDSKYVNAVGRMLDLFVDSHFSEEGSDLIYWWLFESVKKVIYDNDDKEIELSTVEDLWDYLENNGYIIK